MAEANSTMDTKQIPPPYEEDESDQELGGSMSFLEHLTELRERLIKSLVALAIGVAISFMYVDKLIDLIEVCVPPTVKLVGLSPTEEFMTAFSVAFVAGIFLAFPVLFYQAWMFIAPGLYKKERKIVLPLVIASWVCFILGGLFCYFVVFRFTLDFLAGFLGLESMWSIRQFVTFTVRFILAFGIVFEEPVVILLLARIGLVDYQSLKKFFPYAVLVIFTVAAVITPPDPFSQIACGVPLVALYGLSMLIVLFVQKKREEEPEAWENE